MRVGLIAPMKAPDHPVPSGDRQMARLLGRGLGLAGHRVDLLTSFRSFMPAPDPDRATALAAEAEADVERIAASWRDPALRPAAILAYHLHYKAPDLIGLPLARRFALPYLTAEASYARKRNTGAWAARQALVVEAVRAAAVNICFTPNDRAGLWEIVGEDSLVDLPPFIDAGAFKPSATPRTSGRDLITVAMMRAGDKFASYGFLAEALAQVSTREWHLTIVGDGPARAGVEALFARFPAKRITFAGKLDEEAIADRLRAADLFVWPGFNEAFGLCYLEAQACGLPALAVIGEGTPSVIRYGQTGWLVPAKSAAYANAIDEFLGDAALRARFGAAATRFVQEERSLAGAATRLDAALQLACRRHREATHG